ncbi:MAG TPA: hypothetical protein VKY74_15335, partial [Chloroflexia bacterium]|nr:hypothetical protein [Chloroflexia bacterium]
MFHKSRRSWSALLMLAVLGAFAAAMGLLQASAAPAGSAPAPGLVAPPAGSPAANGVRVVWSLKNDVSPPLRDIPPVPVTVRHDAPENPRPPIKAGTAGIDPVIQRGFGPLAMPTPSVTFDGIDSVASGCGCLPPDTNADVGTTQIVETVNTSFAVYSKAGAVIQTPRAINTLWSGFGGACQTHNDGDPVVLWDTLANRWFISQFTSSSPYDMCIAVSTTADATGSYNRYAFQMSTTDLYDYEKYGVWPDAYYMTANVFQGNGGFHPSAVAFDRTRMLGGLSASFQEFNPGNFYANILPTNFGGTVLPPAGAPNTFLTMAGNSNFIHTWKFHVDFINPPNSTFTGPVDLAAAPWDPNLCNGSRNCIPQPPPVTASSYLDSLYDHPMFRLAYRNFGDHEALLTNESVNVGNNQSGIRWYEIRNPSSTPSIYQQGTYAPDATNRWMGSINMDRDGNIAVGYNVSSLTVFPGIRYAGRLASDPLNQLSQGEATLIVGTGEQQSGSGRWGDYSSMSVDPSDDCTFVFAGEYYATIGNANWKTRIGSFKFPSCGSITPTPTATGTPPTATPSATPSATATPAACLVYNYSTSTGTLVPGTVDIGNHCDDCTTYITLPFTIQLYNQPYTNAYVSSNGVLEFASSDAAFGNACFPVPVFRYSISPFWDDLITSATGGGVFTSVSGSAPNRVFNVEWRAQELNNGNANVNFEVQLMENSNSFNLQYGTQIGDAGAGQTIGVIRDQSTFTQVSCNTGGLVANRLFSFTLSPCGAGTATPTPTVANTATATPTVCGAPAAWNAGPSLTTPIVRAFGVYYAPNGKLYAMGGRSSDAAGSDYTHPLEYDPVANTWTTKAGTYPDNQVNNMACGALTAGSTPLIYCVGGSAAGASTATARVFTYNPTSDVVTAL